MKIPYEQYYRERLEARIQELEEENEELRKDNASLEFILGQKEKEDNTLK